MIVTSENYYSPEANRTYMSASQFKAFRRCEACALAELRGEYEREKTSALLVGSYVDAYFDGSLALFKAKTPELFTRAGELKSDYKQAEYIIQRLERDPAFMAYLTGERQTIMTGSIEGVAVKIRMDFYIPGERIVDLKVMRDFERVWVEGEGKLPFVEAWGYDIQGAIYREVVRQNTGDLLPFYLAAATKEKEPDHGIFEIPPDVLDTTLETVKADIVLYDAVKNGLEEPERCDGCDWCRRTKVVAGPVDYRLL